MKDKLPNDRLEEFLRKNLEGHSEDPPGDLWSKIAGNLEPPVAVQPRLTHVRGRWALAGAAVVVMLLLVGQHLYFNQKINRMSQELERNTNQLRQLEQEKMAAQQTKTTNSGGAVATEQNSPVPPSIVTDNTTPMSAEERKNKRSFSQKESRLKNAPATFPKEKTQVSAAKKTVYPNPPVAILEKETGANGLASDGKSSPATTDEPLNSPANTTENPTAESADLQRIWSRELVLLEIPQALSPLTNSRAVATKLGGTGYSVGLHVMPMASRLTINKIRRPGPFPGAEKSFELKREITGQSLMAGLVFEKAVAPRLSIGSGVDYRTMDYRATHKVEFDFKDRRGHRPHMPGMGDNEHEFQYSLATAVGAVAMDVRASSSDSTVEIPDNEKVGAEISTSQALDFLSLPFYAGYNLGNGRLRVLAKAGVLFNFVLNNEFRVDEIKSLNPKFDFRQKDRQSGSPANLQTISLDYLAGIGLEYRATSALSLRMEPTVVGSLTSRHNNPRIQSSEFSAGVSAGVMYSF